MQRFSRVFSVKSLFSLRYHQVFSGMASVFSGILGIFKCVPDFVKGMQGFSRVLSGNCGVVRKQNNVCLYLSDPDVDFSFGGHILHVMIILTFW